ncbi:hypothetical protein pb186bvf_002392 [Paramecium bursaria]
MRLFLLAMIVMGVIAQSDLQEVQSMLLHIKNDIHEQLKALDAQWEQQQKEKQSSVQSLVETKREQVQECERRDIIVFDKSDEIQALTDFIAWIQNRIIVNKDRITQLEALQCRQNLNFIDTIRDDKVSLTVANYLREQIARIVSENTSFYQKTQAMHNILSFLQKIKDNNYEFLDLQREAEINPAIELVDMGPIEYSKFEETKNEVLVVLEDLEKHITDITPRGQTNMIRVGIAYLQWKERILKENEYFELKLIELRKLLENYEDQLVTLTRSVEVCNERVNDVDNAIVLTKEDAGLSYDQYINLHDKLIKELAVFTELYKMYDKQVDNITNEQDKKHIEDNLHAETESLEDISDIQAEAAESVNDQITDLQYQYVEDTNQVKQQVLNNIFQELLIASGPLKLEKIEDPNKRVRADFILS